MKIPKRFENVKKEDIPKEIINLFLNLPSGKGMYLYGGVGTGKTHIIWALAKIGEELNKEKEEELNKKDGKTHCVGWYSCDVVNVAELLRQIKSEFDRDNKDDTLADLLNPDEWDRHKILVLDDVGSEKLSDWVKETFYQIINNRYENKKPFIITSNFSIEQLAERIGDRIVSRIVEMCDIIELKGEDRRMANPKKIEIK